MSWFRALKDEFTLRPFEIEEQTHNDSAAMASGPPDVLTNQEPAEGVEECSGKKKSKFQTFKKFFARKKRKEPPAAGAEAGLKASQSTDNVSKTSENNTLTRSEKDKGSGSKISLGSKALSHDSIFVSDSSEATEALGASQDNIHGKVKSLQLQLRQAIRLGSPPSLMCVKRTDDGGTMSEDDGLPCSPPEYTPLHVAMSQNQAQRDSSISLEGIDSDSDQLSCAASSRAVSPLVVPGDFSQPASPFGCLDNSAAKHKLGLRHKACNRRKPARLEMKAEGESVVEETTVERQEATEVVSGDELKPKRGEDEEEEEEERRGLLRDEEEREEEESKAEKDVSHDPDSSSPPEQGLSEEGGPDTQSQSSSKPGSRPSSLDTPGATPEPPAGPREYLLDPPGIAYGVELMRVESDLTLSGDEDGVQEIREEEEEEEEESSFLQEVLSSLKTPLASCSLGLESEGVALEIEEEQEEEKEQEDVEEVKDEEDAEVDETVSYQAAPATSFLSDQTEEDEEEEEEEEEEATLNTPSCRDVDEEEKVEDEEEAAAEEEEESSPHRQEEEAEEEEVEEEEAKEVTPEEEDHMLTGNTVNQAEEEGREEEEEEEREESEGEMEAIELEKEVEKEEEGREKREEEDEEAKSKEAKERVEEAEEAMEEEEAEEMFPDAADEEVAVATLEEDEGVDVLVGDDGETEPVHESQAESEQEREGGDEMVEEGGHTGQRSEEEEEEEEANRPDEGQSEPDEGIETSHEAAERAVASKPRSLSLPESHDETQTQHSGPSTPSKTSTLHINLLSPSSEKTAASFFQQSPTEEEAPRHAEAAAEKHEEEEGEPADSVEVPEEEKQLEPEGEAPPPVEGEAPPPASVEGEVNQPSGGSDQSKDQFIDKEEGSPSPSSSSPSAVTTPGGEEVEEEKEEAKEEPATLAKVELVLSPGRVRNAGSSSPSSTNAEERSGGVEGNNPFGVRLRKTSALHRFSSEEENAEAPAEPPAQPTSCRVDSPQPIITKQSASQPISSKPSLPKKPDVPGDAGGKNKRMSDPAPLRGVSGGSESPSWISVAKQKQKIYKENSLEEISVRKEEQERKSSLPMFVSSAGRESTGKVSPLEVSRPSASIEKETRRSLSPPTPVPPQPPKSQSLPCPVPPKPQLPPATAKHPPQPNSPQRSLSPPTPIPQKSPSCTSPPSPSKTATSSSKLTSPPFSSRTGPDKSSSRAPGLSSQTLTSQRGLPPAALPQDEPPWMALAKKKAKAWSEMPQIVQ